MDGLLDAGADAVLADAALMTVAALEQAGTVVTSLHVEADGSVVLVDVDIDGVGVMQEDGVEIVVRRCTRHAPPKWHVIDGVRQ